MNQNKIVLWAKFLAKIANPFITAARLSEAESKIWAKEFSYMYLRWA